MDFEYFFAPMLYASPRGFVTPGLCANLAANCENADMPAPYAYAAYTGTLHNMKLCQECNAPLVGRQRLFCSIHCRNTANGRKAGGRNCLGHTKACENCGKVFPIPGNRIATARACSRKCLGKIQSRERKDTGWQTGPANPTWKGGIQTYRRHRRDACEQCGSDRHLVVHHKDENRYNNDLSNLETLCRRCHQIHHRCIDNLPKEPRPKQPWPDRICEGCGAVFTPRSRKMQRFCTQRCWLTIKNKAR